MPKEINSDQKLSQSGKFFFAVGVPFSLKRNYYSELDHEWHESTSSIHPSKARTAIYAHKNIPLFNSYAEAATYRYYSTEQDYNWRSDLFVDTECAPIYVVQIKEGAVYQQNMETKSDYWVQASPNPPSVQEKTMNVTHTSKENLQKVSFIKAFDVYENRNRFFKTLFYPCPEKLTNELTHLWENKMDNELRYRTVNDLHSLALKCVTALFESYSAPFYVRFTRHNQGQVAKILEDIKGLDTLDKLQSYFDTKLTEARDKFHTNRVGHYFKMLELTCKNLEEFGKMNQLEGISEYLPHQTPHNSRNYPIQIIIHNPRPG